MRFIDSFIKNAENLGPEILFKKRILVLLLQVGIFLAMIVLLFQTFGFFEEEKTTALFVLCIIALLITKYTGEDGVVLSMIILSIFNTLYVNIQNTGNTYSYNHKWYILSIFMVFLMRPKWLVIVIPLNLLMQVFFYYQTGDNVLLKDVGTIEEHFIDNLIFIGAFCLFMWIFDIHNNLQSSRINNQNAALTQQKQELQVNNEKLKEMTQELIVSNQELERFAFVASHDLKEPCQNIIGFLKILKRKINLEEKDTQVYYDILENNALQMRELIRDTLEFSNVKEEEIIVERVEVGTLLENLKKLLLPQLKTKNAQVIVGNNMPTLQTQKIRLQKVFKNLIENGVKYNESKEPLIEVEYISKKDEKHLFRIQDNGISIDPSNHDRIFDMYVRLHNREQYSGTGLGLAICKKIITQMEGKIWVESKPNVGSTFYLQLPNPDKI